VSNALLDEITDLADVISRNSFWIRLSSEFRSPSMGDFDLSSGFTCPVRTIVDVTSHVL
jgi:hypothetical protein